MASLLSSSSSTSILWLAAVPVGLWAKAPPVGAADRFDLQLTDLPIQKIDLRFTGRRRNAAIENASRSVQQLLLPGVDLVRVNPVRARQIGYRPVPLDRRQRHLRLERRPVLLACLFHVLLPRHRRFLGAGLHLTYCLVFGVQLREHVRMSTMGWITTLLVSGTAYGLL